MRTMVLEKKRKESDYGLDVLISLLLICVAIFGIWYGVLASVQKTIDTLAPPPNKTPTPSSPTPSPPAPSPNTPPTTTQDDSNKSAGEDKIDPKVIGISAGVAVFIISAVFIFTRYSPVQRMLTYSSIYSWIFIIGVIFCIVGATSVDGNPRWICIGIGIFLIFLSWVILFSTRRLKLESIVDDALERLEARLESKNITEEEQKEALMRYKQDTEGVSEAVHLVLHLHGNESNTPNIEHQGMWSRFVGLFQYRQAATAVGAAVIAYKNPGFAIQTAIVAALLPSSIYRSIGRLLHYTKRRAFGVKLKFDHTRAIDIMKTLGIDDKEATEWLANDSFEDAPTFKIKQA